MLWKQVCYFRKVEEEGATEESGKDHPHEQEENQGHECHLSCPQEGVALGMEAAKTV